MLLQRPVVLMSCLRRRSEFVPMALLSCQTEYVGLPAKSLCAAQKRLRDTLTLHYLVPLQDLKKPRSVHPPLYTGGLSQRPIRP